MPTYNYKARDAAGNLVENTAEADNETAAALAIEQLGYSPVSISLRRAGTGFAALLDPRKRISRQETLIFTRQLATLIATGIPLIQALENTAGQAANKEFAAIIRDIIASVKGGSSLSEALARYPQIFPGLYVSLVRVGEAGGLLDEVLQRLAELSTQDIDLRSRLRSVLIYPAVLASIAFVIVNFILIGVLPKFVTIFEASQAKLPLPTQLLLGISYVLRNYWWVLAAALLFGINLFGNYYRSSKGKLKVDTLALRLPLFGPLILKVMVTRFARSISYSICSKK